MDFKVVPCNIDWYSLSYEAFGTISWKKNGWDNPPYSFNFGIVNIFHLDLFLINFLNFRD